MLNLLAICGIAPWLIACLSGHEFPISTLFEYLQVLQALLLLAAVVANGWGPGCHDYGKIGPGAKPARLFALKGQGVSETQMDDLVDCVLHLKKDFSPPKWLRGGHDRTFIYSVFASLVMYHEESVQKCEVPIATEQLRLGMVQKNLAASPALAEERLATWGS